MLREGSEKGVGLGVVEILPAKSSSIICDGSNGVLFMNGVVILNSIRENTPRQSDGIFQSLKQVLAQLKRPRNNTKVKSIVLFNMPSVSGTSILFQQMFTSRLHHHHRRDYMQAGERAYRLPAHGGAGMPVRPVQLLLASDLVSPIRKVLAEHSIEISSVILISPQ